MRRSTIAAIAITAPFVVVAGVIAVSTALTEADIATHEERVRGLAVVHPSPEYDASTLLNLPTPVQEYFRFTFGAAPNAVETVSFRMEGQFRRPRTDTFSATRAEQTIAVGTPALVFSATTPIVPGIWARAYDAFAEGSMEMKAKIMSTITVVAERESDALNRISLRRWLMESPMYPMALLPGGPVRWEPIDRHRARAIVTVNDLSAELVATFRPDGGLETFDAEEDGDLNTPYHGSGEHATRSDYRLVDGIRIPMKFSIARAAGGNVYPFWSGRVTDIWFKYAPSK